VTGGKVAEANDINENGLVVGQSDGFATSWPRGVPTKLGFLPGSTTNEALKSNFGGTAVGDATFATGEHRAVVFSGGTATDLNLPTAGGADVRAKAINDGGTTVGTGDVKSGSTAVRYAGGQVVDLNTLIPAGSGLTLRTATDVNNDGQIVGSATPASDPNAIVGYVLTPVTERYLNRV
jgi:probable HAF family extracellular repeat protein